MFKNLDRLQFFTIFYAPTRHTFSKKFPINFKFDMMKICLLNSSPKEKSFFAKRRRKIKISHTKSCSPPFPPGAQLAETDPVLLFRACTVSGRCSTSHFILRLPDLSLCLPHLSLRLPKLRLRMPYFSLRLPHLRLRLSDLSLPHLIFCLPDFIPQLPHCSLCWPYFRMRLPHFSLRLPRFSVRLPDFSLPLPICLI